MNNQSFTLLELVVVIVILGILATLGYNQYSLMVEKGRTAEAIARLGVMRTLAQEYYLKNGSYVFLGEAEVGSEGICNPNSWYDYWATSSETGATLWAFRCTSGGREPNASRQYILQIQLGSFTSIPDIVCCYYNDSTFPSCFGMPNCVNP